MEDYKHYLNENADEAERQTAEQVLDGLTTLRVRHQVKAVETARKAYFKQQFRQFVTIILAIVALTALALWYWSSQRTTPALDVTNPGPNQQADQPMAQQPASPDVASSPAVASATRLPRPRFPAPRYSDQIRGTNPTPAHDTKQQAILNQLWYTEYPLTGLVAKGNFTESDQLLRNRDFETAYIRLNRLERKQSDNDTLYYLKGYCLLEMGQSDLALTYFNQIKKRPSSWKPQLQWYQALAYLHKGNPVKALALFRQIAETAGHPYQPQSQLAVTLLE